MVFIDIPQKKKTLYLPENLSECEPRQFADMAKLLYLLQIGEINYYEFRNLAVYALLGLKPSAKLNDNQGLLAQNIFLLSEKMDGFFETIQGENGQESLRPKLELYKNPLPKYRYFSTFYGPEDGFANVSFGQYTDGLEEFLYYSQSGDLQALRTLFAIFYLKKGETYSLSRSKKRANKAFKFVDIRHLYGFYLYFIAMQDYILSGRLLVMGNEIDLNIIYQETKNAKKEKSLLPGVGWVSTIYDLAESGVFGNYEGVRNTNMWQVLIRLYELKKKQLDEEAVSPPTPEGGMIS